MISHCVFTLLIAGRFFKPALLLFADRQTDRQQQSAETCPCCRVDFYMQLYNNSTDVDGYVQFRLGTDNSSSASIQRSRLFTARKGLSAGKSGGKMRGGGQMVGKGAPFDYPFAFRLLL